MACDPWPIRWACDVQNVDPEMLDLVQQAATNILWGLTGRRYGVCSTTEAYIFDCGSPCNLPWSASMPDGVRYVYDTAYGAPFIRWWNDGRCKIQLARQPVRQVIEVRLNGAVLDASNYDVQRDGLTRLTHVWPCASGCSEAPVEVDYEFGFEVPPLGELAMGELACELLAALEGRDCQLPSNVTSVARQGTTITLGDAATLFGDSRTGLPVVDAFIQATNPNRLRQSGRVASPDLARHAK